MKKKKKQDILIEYFEEQAKEMGLKVSFDYSLKNKKEIDGFLKGKYKYKKVLETMKND